MHSLQIYALYAHKGRGYNKNKLQAYATHIYLEKSTKLEQAFCHLLGKGRYLLGSKTYFDFALYKN